jgi:hypothetical protein
MARGSRLAELRQAAFACEQGGIVALQEQQWPDRAFPTQLQGYEAVCGGRLMTS